MRTIGLAQSAFDMMCERALSRETQGGLLADKQFVQGYIADSYAELEQFRLFVLHRRGRSTSTTTTARCARTSPAVKVLMPDVCTTWPSGRCRSTAPWASTNEMPFSRMMLGARRLGLADGPTEVHKVTVARQVLRDHHPSDDLWPTQHLPKNRAPPREKYAEYLEHEVGNL